MTATYEFVTDGRLGPTGINVRDALEKASDGDVDDILQLIDGKTKGVAVSSDSLRRASIRAEGSAYADLISRAEARAQGLLLNVTSQAEAEERGRWVMLELLNAVTERSGLTYEDDRVCCAAQHRGSPAST